MAKSRGVFILFILLTGLTLAGYQYFSKNKVTTTAQKDKPLFLQNSNDAFTQSMNAVVAAYLAMKDAFVQGDSSAVKQSAAGFSQKLDSIAWNQLQADSNLVSLGKSLQKEIQASSNHLVAATDFPAMHRDFQSSSDLLFDLLRSVQYKGARLYQQFCPMAFNNTGAHWLSAETEILNPYFGNKMLHCGEIKDSLSFVQ
jgi:Cu(I)/Ag(I) efflux system membrane fusion protein